MNLLRSCFCAAGIVACLQSCGPHPETSGAVAVLPDTVLMMVGDTITLTALTFDTTPGMSRASVFWETQNSAVVRVSASGLTRAMSVGTTFVTAAAEHVRDSAVITVVPDSQPAIRFASMVQPIFTSKCATTGCHVGPSSPLGLDLSEGESYRNVYNVVAREARQFRLIEPYRTDRSWLITEFEAHLHLDSVPSLDKIPDGFAHEGVNLTREDLATIRQWIQSAAPNN